MENKYIFVHIPKTAGTSLRSLFVDIFSEDQVSPSFPVCTIDAHFANRLNSYKVICGHISMLDIERYFPERKLITFLREPIDRCLSIYGYFRQQTQHPLIPLDEIRGLNDAFEATSIARQSSIEDFFNSLHPHCIQNIQNRMVWQLGYAANVELREQITETIVLERAKSALKFFYFVGIYENLEKDVEQLYSLFGASKRLLPKYNVTALRPHMSELSEATRKKINELTLLDNDLYSYITRQ